MGNVGDWDSTVEAFTKAKSEHGSIDVLVNNAGITRDRMFVKMTREDWDAVIETNLNSMFNVTKQVVGDMVEKGWGRIVNISSVNGEKGQAGQTNYSAAKAGMHGFSMALAQELATKGVTVNTVSPGYIGTDMVKAIRPDVLKDRGDGAGQAPGRAQRDRIHHLVAFLGRRRLRHGGGFLRQWRPAHGLSMQACARCRAGTKADKGNAARSLFSCRP